MEREENIDKTSVKVYTLMYNSIKEFNTIYTRWHSEGKSIVYEDAKSLLKSLVGKYFREDFGKLEYNLYLKKSEFLPKIDMHTRLLIGIGILDNRYRNHYVEKIHASVPSILNVLKSEFKDKNAPAISINEYKSSSFLESKSADIKSEISQIVDWDKLNSF